MVMKRERLPRRTISKTERATQLHRVRVVVTKSESEAPAGAAPKKQEGVNMDSVHDSQGEVQPKSYNAEVKCNVAIAKIDSEKRLVYGVVLEPDEVDAQNDTINSDVIEEAAHAFLASYNRETKLGLMHRLFGNIGVELAQSYISLVDMTVQDQPVKKGSWLMVVKVLDESVWKKIKAGEITGYSIGGMATLV